MARLSRILRSAFDIAVARVVRMAAAARGGTFTERNETATKSVAVMILGDSSGNPRCSNCWPIAGQSPPTMWLRPVRYVRK